MKAIRVSFLQMMVSIRKDMMLLAACIAPILAGLMFRFVIPFVEKMLVQWTGKVAILLPYYGIFDLFYSMLAPMLFCFAAAMVMLEEQDDHVETYLFVTGLGRKGYLISRILIPAVAAFLVTAVLLPIFKLTELSVSMIILLAVAGTLQGIIIALMTVTISTNKLEGMAVTKMSTIIVLGVFVPYFVPKETRIFATWLPSFWAGEAMYENAPVYMRLSVLLSGVWIGILLGRFWRKLA